MSILAVYDHAQLELPHKVLTHREDIDPLLQAAGVRLTALEGLPRSTPEQPDDELLGVYREWLATRYTDIEFGHGELQRQSAVPGYAEAQPEDIEAERRYSQRCAQLLISGAGLWCLHHEQQLLVLSGRRADVVALPAGLAHWFVPGPGQPGLLLRFAGSAPLTPALTGSDIAARYQVLDL